MRVVDVKLTFCPTSCPARIEAIHWRKAREAASGETNRELAWAETLIGVDGSPIPHAAWLWANIYPSGSWGRSLSRLEKDKHLLRFRLSGRGVLCLYASQIPPTPDGALRTMVAANELFIDSLGAREVRWNNECDSLQSSTHDFWNHVNNGAEILPPYSGPLPHPDDENALLPRDWS